MRILAVLGIVFAAAGLALVLRSRVTEQVPTPALGEPFAARVGQAFVVDGLNLTVNKVLTDSRCPSDAVCEWIGWAVVELALQEGMTTQVLPIGNVGGKPVALKGPYVPDSLDYEPGPLYFGSYAISLTGIDPARVTSDAISERDYSFSFVVTKQGKGLPSLSTNPEGTTAASADEAVPFQITINAGFPNASLALRSLVEEDGRVMDNNFCIVGYRLSDGSESAWVYWQENNAMILWEPTTDASPRLALSRRYLRKDKDVVPAADVDGSTYLVTDAWWNKTTSDCNQHGERFSIALQ